MYFQRCPRGTAAQVCQNTEVTAPELSNWLSSTRDLPAHKLVAVYDWMMAKGLVTITFH